MLRPNLKHTTSFFKESLNLFTYKRTFATISQKVCHYEVLGVKPNAALVEIKKAYYQKAKLFHPDTNKEENAEETFKVITKAYETLKDPVSRQIYDLSKSNPNFDQDIAGNGEGNSAYAKYYASNSDAESQKRHYYNNKWYGYGKKKPSEENIRDEYNNMRSKLAEESILDKLVVRVGIVLGAIFAFDAWQKYNQSKHNDFVSTQKEILKGGSSIFESPLVFVRKSANKSNESEKDIEKNEVAVIDLGDYINKRKEKVQKEENSYHNEF